MPFTAKQSLFIKEYLVDLNATQAAIRAGYSAKTAGAMGDENLKKPEIAIELQKHMDKRSARVEISADYVLTSIKETMERCKQAVPVLRRNGDPVLVENAEGDMVPAYAFEPNAVMKGAELLGRHLKLFTDKHELSGKDGEAIEVKVDATLSPSDSYMRFIGK